MMVVEIGVWPVGVVCDAKVVVWCGAQGSPERVCVLSPSTLPLLLLPVNPLRVRLLPSFVSTLLLGS